MHAEFDMIVFHGAEELLQQIAAYIVYNIKYQYLSKTRNCQHTSTLSETLAKASSIARAVRNIVNLLSFYTHRMIP